MITRQPWLVVLWASIACIRLVKGWNRGGTVLAADIGGTYTRLSLIEMGKVWRNLSVMRISERYINSNYETLDDIISDFLIKAGPYAKPNGACFAVAGPCMNNVGKLVNGAHGEGEKGGQWVVDGKEIAKRFESLKSVRVINDFVAAGYGILTLNDYEDCVVVHDAPKIRSAPMACIGAGTGLGQCFLIPSGGSSSLSASYDCFPSEGGHAEFAPHNDLEHDLLHYLERKLGGRVSVERVVSGSGIPNIYEFLTQKFPELVDPAVDRDIASAFEFKAAMISKYQHIDELCKRTMDIFIRCYGSEAGLAGLKFLPYGGLYLTGGLTPKNVESLKDPNGAFLKAFHNKGRVSSTLKNVPVYAVLVDDLGERGAYYCASRDLMQKS